MTEREWRTNGFALTFLPEAARLHQRMLGAEDVDSRRLLAVKVACLARLGADLPSSLRDWVEQAAVALDGEDHVAKERLLFSEAVYQSFRDAYTRADPVLQQRLAAAQDAYHGSDYYACEEYMLEKDEEHTTFTGLVYAAESAAHCDLIRCIFGNPFRPVTFSPAWRSESAVSLARTAYDTRDFTLLPILADALEEAGCDHADILNHCRDPKGVHARGCWVVDLVLNKS